MIGGGVWCANVIDQCREIAETKMNDLNAASVEAATRIIMGTARSCGIEVKGE